VRPLNCKLLEFSRLEERMANAAAASRAPAKQIRATSFARKSLRERLKTSRDRLDLEALDLIAFADVLIIGKGHAAFLA
jgi:hypothetical protein